ncbi:AMP-dependent synthetase [Mycobacterium sp. PS03-16]|uniref:AMP-binding protein n=1 Tax=Mycobacterium sp. PS03-16 TaxID=2559611 RepID=UPI00107412B6|nr:AMP-binding protein [Mycobacterium sp. PS03-16]TFV56587.1 AMP-dependent synthetase [Mycobacterium sp. PS03-16]
MTLDTTRLGGAPPTRRAVAADEIGDPPRIRTVTGLLADGAADTPDAELLRFGDESWTYGQADAASSRLAHRLIETDGIAPDDRVAIMLPNIAGWPLTWLAALKAGAVAVPVNSAYRAADLQFVLTDSGARVIVTDADHLPLVREVIDGDPDLMGIAVVDIADTADASFPATPPEVTVGPDTLANLQYTSGTTGFPKACMLTHDYWTRIGWACAAAVGLGPDDVLLTAQPFSYMDPQWNTVLALTTGAQLVVLPRFSASGFMADVRRHGATFCYVLGSMPTLLFKQSPAPEDRDHRLRAVFCSAIPVALHADLEERWGAPWREVYGMTETGIDLFSPFDDASAVGTGTLGDPLPTKRIRIVDADGAEVPDGTPGELTVSGAPMMLGYWNRPDATAETLRDGWLHTGDVAVHDEHGYRLVGRLKDMVRRGGENVAAVEVEAALEHDDAVVASAVVAEPDPVLGEEVKAFVQLAPGLAADRAAAAAIIARVAGRLAKFKVPRYVEFVSDFPRTPSQRVSKPTLKARAAEVPGTVFDLRAPAPSNKENPVQETVDPTEHVLVEVVREVAVITLRRPDKLNALTVGMRRRLAALIREYGTGERARGIVLTGTGRAFSAGEDLSAAPTSFGEMRVSFESFHDVTRAVIETRVPVVAAVNGIAVGGASEITLCCDGRIGVPETVYYQPENSRGLTISNASSLLLPRIVRGHAMRMILGSERIAADEALRIGLLDEVIEPTVLVDRAVDTIHAWTPEGANTTALHLELLRPTLDEIERAFAREDAAADEAWNSGALTAGVQGFWDARSTPAAATTGGTR